VPAAAIAARVATDLTCRRAERGPAGEHTVNVRPRRGQCSNPLPREARPIPRPAKDLGNLPGAGQALSVGIPLCPRRAAWLLPSLVADQSPVAQGDHHPPRAVDEQSVTERSAGQLLLPERAAVFEVVGGEHVLGGSPD